jgi:hypothetical protein
MTVIYLRVRKSTVGKPRIIAIIDNGKIKLGVITPIFIIPYRKLTSSHARSL